jgi:hypothetical protein
MEWYNGYCIGSCQVINPWSFMSYIRNGKLISYWTNTGNLDSIFSTISPESNLDLIKALREVYNSNNYTIGELLTSVNYSKAGTVESILSFLVHTGYLTYQEGKVTIPNKEVKLEWKDYILGLTSENVVLSKTYFTILNALNPASFHTSVLLLTWKKRIHTIYFIMAYFWQSMVNLQ